MDRIQQEAHPNDAGFTVAEYAERYNMARTTAREKLRTLVDKKLIIKGKRLINGRSCPVYRPA